MRPGFAGILRRLAAGRGLFYTGLTRRWLDEHRVYQHSRLEYSGQGLAFQQLPIRSWQALSVLVRKRWRARSMQLTTTCCWCPRERCRGGIAASPERRGPSRPRLFISRRAI